MTQPTENGGKYPELVFGLIRALGSDLDIVREKLQEAIASVGYQSLTIRLSHLMKGIAKAPWSELKETFDEGYLNSYMDAGNELRRKLGRGDALVLLGISALRQFREKNGADADSALSKQAYVFHSLTVC